MKFVDTIGTLMVVTGLIIAAYTMYQITQGTSPTMPQFALFYSIGTTAGMAALMTITTGRNDT